jgi:hypothetical protein
MDEQCNVVALNVNVFRLKAKHTVSRWAYKLNGALVMAGPHAKAYRFQKPGYILE